MTEVFPGLAAALADRYRIDTGSGHAPTLLGQGSMATVIERGCRPSAGP